MAFNSHPIEVTILLIEEVIFSILPIDGFQVLALVLAPSNNTLHPQEVVAVISATYNGLHRVLNEAAHKARISTQANKIPYTLLQPCHTEAHKIRSPMLMMMTILSDLQRIYKWKMKRRRIRWLHQEDSRVMTTNKKMLRNFPLHSNRKHLLQLQLSLHQIYQPG